MMTHRCGWVRAGLASAALVAGVLSVPALTGGTAGALETPVESLAVAGDTGTVTLVTGDRVTVHEDGHVSVVAESGRSEQPFTTYRRDGHVHVLPADAAPLVAGGRFGPHLFDVTGLLAAGYGDRTRDHLPLILSHIIGTPAQGVLDGSGVEVTRDLPAVAGVAVSLDKDEAAGFWQELTAPPDQPEALQDGPQVWLDATLRVQLTESVPQVGAPDAWATGFDGAGTTVAVLDTGIDDSHADLTGKVAGRANFTEDPAADQHGHGTHVASTVAGTGAAAGGTSPGVAPSATLLDGKVCDAAGDCQSSAIIDGMQWAADQGADVVNLSAGGGDSAGVDPVEEAVNSLTSSHNTLFVIAAGNTGATRSVNSPASADAALAVGAVDSGDFVASFSSRGPRTGDSAIKPEITAPGVDINAARSGDSDLPGAFYTSLSGTSMAAPHVAGAAAILTQRHPDWSPALRKAALMAAATPDPALSPFVQGAGRLEVAAAVELPVTADPPAVSLGLVEPGEGDTVTRTVTYQNHGTGDVTLSLELEALGPGGAAPTGLFTVDSSAVTVPAGGEAPVTLTAAVGTPGPAGLYSGWIIARTGDTVVRTPFGFERAIPLTFDHIGRSGGTPVAYTTFVMRVDGPEQFIVSDQPGPVTVWVPDGTYLVMSSIIDAGPGGQESTLLTVPRLEATGPQSFVMDARQAQPVEIEVPDQDAELWAMELGFELQLAADQGFSITSAVRSGAAYLGAVGAGPDVPGFRTKITSDQIVPGPDGDETDSPLSYHLAWFVDGQVPAGFEPDVSAADLAAVTARHAAHLAGGLGYKTTAAQPAGGGPFASGISFGLPFQLPSERTERYHAGEGADVAWVTRFSEHVASTNAHLVTTQSSPIRYAAGSAQEQWWNRPVYWPAFAAPVGPADWVSRDGDQLRFLLPLFGDGDGRAGRPDAGTVAGEVTISRDGDLLHEGPYEPEFGRVLAVPPGSGTYQLAVTATRTEPAILSTQVSAEWTFQSTTTDSLTRQPLWTVRMTPPLDESGAAPAGGSFTFPVLAAPQPGSDAAALAELSVEFSVDDGATWQPATVSPAGSGHIVQLTHPDQPGFVSLRARAADTAGNAVEQQVIRAYRIG